MKSINLGKLVNKAELKKKPGLVTSFQIKYNKKDFVAHLTQMLHINSNVWIIIEKAICCLETLFRARKHLN